MRMENKALEVLKRDLLMAITQKDYAKIEEIRKYLNISNEQTKYFEQGLTGYPSVDRIWLKHYSDGAEDHANNIPTNKTVWDVMEEKILEYYDYPALEYFGKVFSREEFRNSCYTWARTFRAMGVEENEVVPVYGPFVPDVCAMVFGLNMIGACPYFLKLAISKEALAEETKDSKIAVVYDGMWANVAEEFMKDRFKKVIVATVTADMPSPKKEIVSFLSSLQARKNKSKIPDDKKYIWADKAKEIADYYKGNVKVPFKSNRSTFITSSSGTTVGGVVKGVIATNESTISQLYMADASEVLYFPGEKCLNHFPPTASTSLNILFMLPLYRGLEVIIDPRVSEKDFYNQITKYLPQLAVNTGSMWETFFNRIEKELKEGKKFDFSAARGWVVGGEGTDVKKFLKWKEIMKQCGSEDGLASAYGTSELFSATCTEKYDARCDFKKTIMSVGIPYAGMKMGVFDENGNELSYNERGNLWIKSNSVMKGYYNKPELTSKSLVDGWFKTGDMAEIDKDGYVYIWGRLTDKIVLDDNTNVYMFDVANKLKEFDFIDDAIVLSMPTNNNPYNLVGHIVINEKFQNDKEKCYETINDVMSSYLPSNVVVSAYSEHQQLPYSSTTLKKDKNKLSKQTRGYIQFDNGKFNNVEFNITENGKYNMSVESLDISKNKVLVKN